MLDLVGNPGDRFFLAVAHAMFYKVCAKTQQRKMMSMTTQLKTFKTNFKRKIKHIIKVQKTVDTNDCLYNNN